MLALTTFPFLSFLCVVPDWLLTLVPSIYFCKIPPGHPRQVKDFDAKPYFNDKKASVRNDRVTLLGVAASKIAIDDAKLDLAAIDGGRHKQACKQAWLIIEGLRNPSRRRAATHTRTERFGVVVGSAFGGLATLETQINELNTKGPSKVRRRLTSAVPAAAAAGTALVLCVCGQKRSKTVHHLPPCQTCS